MKRVVLPMLLAIGLASCLSTALAAKPVQVEVLYMDHGPLQASIRQIKEVFSEYGNEIAVSWYDFESKEGEAFMAKKGIRQHVPLAIWIGGKPKWTVGGKEVFFMGFPTGSGPPSFQGKWTMDDLRGALDQATGTK
jgi:hypothetical protein